MPKVVDHDEMRERLAAAVLPVFLERGYAALSMQALADAAGVAKSGAYHYFATKAAWFGAACAVALRDEVEALRSAAGCEATPLTRLRRILAAQRGDDATMRVRTLVLLEAVRGGAGPDVAPALARYVRDVAALLGVPRPVARKLVMVLAGYALMREIDPQFEADSLLEQIVRHACRSR